MQKHKLVQFFQKLPTLPFVYFSDVRRSKGQQAMTKTVFGYPLVGLNRKYIFIPKPGKESYKVAKSFRPISQSSFLPKGLERVVGLHMEQTVLTKNPLSRCQHGFRRTKSTEICDSGGS